MYLTEEILSKLNKSNGKENAISGHKVTLPDIMVRSFAQVKELAGDTLSWGEKNFLYQQAQAQLKENKMAESRILSRANPQLANAVRLGIRQSSMLGSYDDLFPARSNQYVKPGSVASMFSPAGYLTELYREARGLHQAESKYHLDTRRPDLASLALSQSNMDDELSTLSLSNELLLNNIQQHDSLDNTGVLKMLASYRPTGKTPYSQPYETVRQAILIQDPTFKAFRNNPAVAAKMNTSALLGLTADLPPELHAILTEEITENKADQLVKDNFGDIEITKFQNISYLASWYGLTYEELESVLNIVSIGGDNDPDIQYYQDNSFTGLVNSVGFLSAVTITRTDTDTAELNYAELISHNNGYLLNFNFTTTKEDFPHFYITIKGSEGDKIYENSNFIPEGGKGYSIPVSLEQDKLSAGLTISLTRSKESSWLNSDVTFQSKSYPFSIFLLKINKLIRLYKATGISPSDIETAIESVNKDLTITETVLSRLFWANYYTQHYGIDFSAALVLAGANINQIAHSSKASQFNQIFNIPPLNNQFFYADGKELDLEPGKSADTQSLGVLKRALQVDDTALYTLFKLTFADKTSVFTKTINNLSALYRTRLLATVNNLTVNELSLLLSVSPYANKPLITLAGEELNVLSADIERYVQWLEEMNWTVSDLYLMLAASYSTVLSPDIQNLVTTLKNGLAGQDLTSDKERITAMAPFIAAAMQLDSAETAEAVLQWLSQLKPGNISLKHFVSQVNNTTETQNLVIFCQVMAQLALIARNASLSASELSWAVAHPAIFKEKSITLEHNITTLCDLTQLHALLARSGTHASEILTSLSGNMSTSNNNLAIDTLATALSLDELALTQALAQVSSYKYFYSWIHLRDALQWLDIATTFGISPTNVAALIALKFSNENDASYASWLTASQFMQAGLNTQQTTQLFATLDESLSAAVSTYAIKNIFSGSVNDREQLYSWLLIDNQVSALVKTTRIAEAIASVQLYVNRALSGLEDISSATDAVDHAVKSRAFFSSDWDTYNKRYSTWAGVSELVYYPENYVDPTLRLGQTGMMDEMLQTLSQSQLTSDTVENAFKTYMTRFEEIANLDIVSGYHDSLHDTNGITYLIGRSDIGDYYWRSADIDKMSGGRLPASAWTEWKKITAAPTPVNNLVHPVIFQSRLYVTWVESREIVKSDENQSNTVPTLEYLLKYAHIMHDGTWSAPVSVTLNKGTLPIQITSDNQTLSDVAVNDTGIYCANDKENDQLCILFYQKQDIYKETPKIISGLILNTDATTEIMSVDVAAKIAGNVYQQLDTTAAVRLNTPYSDGEISVSFSGNENYEWGAGSYTIMFGCNLSAFACSSEKESVEITFQGKARVVYNGCSGAASRYQVNMMKAIGEIGDTFSIPASYNKSANKQENFYSLVYKEYGYVTSNAKRDPSSSFGYYPSDYRDTLGQSISNASEKFIKLSYIDSESNIFKAGYINEQYPGKFDYVGKYTEFFLMKYMDLDFEFSDYVDVKTGISKENIKISASIGEIKEPSADECDKYTWDESIFVFKDKKINIPFNQLKSGKTPFTFTFTGVAEDGRSLGKSSFEATLNTDITTPVISLNKTADNAQYLQYGIHRIRVNTLFAKQLIERANAGLDMVLSMATQQLKEPKMGKGAFIDLELNASSDGNSSVFEVLMCDVFTNDDRIALTSGTLSFTGRTSCSFFIPRLDESTASSENMYFCVKVHDAESKKVRITGSEGAWRYEFVDGTTTTDTYIANIYVRNDTTEPMDFNGANALYFWEMFYYVPMMVFKRLLNESKFTEATQWIKYIWNPDGYLVNNQPATYTWNVRPLEEDTSWHADPLDSVNPDAVAQADPLHYKIATFMAYLDLLIARGDAAYRQLERDTLNEAKMWYVQALNILGDEPYQSPYSGWVSPALSSAADQTTEKNVQQAMLSVRQQLDAGELHTANSLTSLFLPQQNEKLAGYWQTLAQRLYNLRHNLSIDGSPLSLAIYAAPADPAALLSAAVNSASGGSGLPAAVMPPYRFPVILESARGMAGQLTQFGSTLLSITERQDAEALSELLQTQGSALILQSIALQSSAIDEVDADKTALEAARSGAQQRLDSYTTLYDENVNTGETQAMDLYLSSSVISGTATALHMAAAAADMVPNIYGLAVGGARYGALLNAFAIGAQIAGNATHTAADRISQSEAWRRRRQEWEIQRNSAQSEVDQIDAQLASLAVRREGAVLQKTYLETQQSQMQAQMTFLQNKFTSKALYNWLRGKLAAIYYQFYDLTVSRCLMAEAAYSWEIKGTQETGAFIRPGAWQGTYAGLMAGETLMLNLAQMENSYLTKDERLKEVTRTVCLSDVYAGLSSDNFALTDAVTTLVTDGSGNAGPDDNGVKINDGQLQATLKLSDLKIGDDYPSALGKTRRIKQISVTLPALVGPYQDVRAVLSYGGSVVLPRGCTAAAVSHGMNDSGQFQLNFNDSRWLPFEGIPVTDAGTLTLSFPDATGKQAELLLSLTDIILHIRYTIAS